MQIAQGFLPVPKRPISNQIVKLNQSKADDIWNSYTGIKGQLSELAKKYGVSQARVANMILYGGWGHIGPHPEFVERQRRIATKKLPKQIGKLAREQREEIRQKYSEKRSNQNQLAREYHVRQGTIWNVVHRKGTTLD